ATREKAFDKILAAGNRAAKITNSVLGIARNRGTDVEPTDLAKLIEDSLVLLEREMNKYRIRVDKRFQEIPQAMVNGNQIQQVLLNLLINARQAMPNGGPLVIKLSHNAEEGMIELVVRDYGSGIPAEKLPKIFEPFFSTKAGPDASGKGGTGLGLSITKDIVRLMGGTISVESTVGKGSVFTVSIKLEKAQREQVESAVNIPADQVFSQDLKVLVVDDSKTNRVMAVKMLAKLGFNADSADNGQEAVEMVSDGSYDLVFMDLQMPKMDGLDATGKILELVKDNKPKIIALTANAFEEDRRMCLDAGMNDYLSKPLTLQKLREIIIAHIDPERIMPSQADGVPMSGNEHDNSSEQAVVSQSGETEAEKVRHAVDLEKVRQNVGGDNDLLLEIFETFATEAIETFTNINSSLENNDSSNAGRYAHGLKGIAWGVGADRLRELCLEAEQAGKGGDIEAVRTKVPEIEQEMNAVLSEINAYISGE
ncbi:MAG: response regulator, partial [Sedimentisphaerales bacterium]|nr:response regulator [Sedimentisphaerales bacterium]